jgi:hypothetical protein
MPDIEKAKVNIAAKQEGMNAVQYLAYKTLEPIAYSKTTKKKGADATFNNKMGSGWGSDNASMERLADEIINSGDLTSPHWEEIPGWSAEQTPKGYKGTNPQAINKGLNGLKAGKDSEGKDIFIVNTAANEDGTISIIVSNNVIDPKGEELMRMPAKDFANNIVNTIAENNTDIKREVLERVLKEKGAVTDQGFVKTKSSGPMIPGKKPATQGGAFIP